MRSTALGANKATYSSHSRLAPALRTEAPKRFSLVLEIREYRMQIRQPQNFLRPRAEVHRSKFSVVFARCENRPNQLPDSGAIQIRKIPHVQENAFPPVPEKIGQQFVHCLSLDQCKSSAHVYNRDVSHLTRAGAETHSVLLLGLGPMILSYAWLES
jgi:hypothetical protein